ncbi:response regulator [Methylobacterium sp. WSM2598]|uniref:response regulator n=1 Tax=Methylobacterium sp. WSM2598 TaxID=398261 RepID=UPI002E81FF10|nr:response regulator [Methylobacterium sp. WSM2598]
MAASFPAGPLAQRRVLVVEDEYFIADDMAQALGRLGAVVVGPAPSRDAAMALIDGGARIDAAVLDINLRGETVFPVGALRVRHGLRPRRGAGGLPGRAHWEKPFDPASLARALPRLLPGFA